MTTKEKRNLTEKVAVLCERLTNKEKNWFIKIMTTPMKDWTDKDIEILQLLYDGHHIQNFSIGGLNISNDDTAEKLWRIKIYTANEKLKELFNKK
jgi:hypothetical protein